MLCVLRGVSVFLMRSGLSPRLTKHLNVLNVNKRTVCTAAYKFLLFFLIAPLNVIRYEKGLDSVKTPAAPHYCDTWKPKKPYT